jgi:hypothetical protein
MFNATVNAMQSQICETYLMLHSPVVVGVCVSILTLCLMSLALLALVQVQRVRA